MVLKSELDNYRVLLRRLKAEYRAITGYDSDSNWNKFHKCLEEMNLLSPQLSETVNRDNVLFFARLRLDLPKTSVPMRRSFEFYLEQKKFTDALNGRRLTGQQIIEHLAAQGISVSRPTRTNWFRAVGGFRSKAEYLPEEILKVLYRAAVYQANKEKKNG